MGRSYTPTYRIEYRTNTLDAGHIAADKLTEVGRVCTMAWRKGVKPNREALKAWVAAHNASCQPGGCNAHLSAGGMVEAISWARIVRQADDHVVAAW